MPYMSYYQPNLNYKTYLFKFSSMLKIFNLTGESSARLDNLKFLVNKIKTCQFAQIINKTYCLKCFYTYFCDKAKGLENQIRKVWIVLWAFHFRILA